ncbi:MAG TPA: hypothetical protein VJQ56_03285 [Blastocatellia bacterium]|nr:hypothetical protein [Blastocatellia bacterium]
MFSINCGKRLAQVGWRNEAVMRINRSREQSKLSLFVEGTLSGEWVAELEKSWLEAKSSPPSEQVRVDLSGVVYVDDKGRKLLARMFRDGTELRATGVMTQGIIEEIADEDALSKMITKRLG